MVAPMEGAAEEQDVDEKMDEELPVEGRSARVVRMCGEPVSDASACSLRSALRRCLTRSRHGWAAHQQQSGAE